MRTRLLAMIGILVVLRQVAVVEAEYTDTNYAMTLFFVVALCVMIALGYAITETMRVIENPRKLKFE